MRNQDDPVDHYPFTAIDHVQLAMPTGEEDRARAFYCTPLGMTELPKPQELVKRGGCWFGSGSVQLHLGIEADFRPDEEGAPGLAVCGLRCADCAPARIDVKEDESIPDVRRCHVCDPFGNRIESIRQGIVLAFR